MSRLGRKLKVGLWKLNRKRYYWCVSLGVFAFLLALFVETLARGSFFDSIVWAVLNPFPLLVTMVFMSIAVYAVGLVVNRFAPAGIAIMIPLACLAIAHAGKMANLHEPLYPWDFSLADDFGAVLSRKYFPYSIWQCIVCVAMMVAVIAAALSMPRPKLSLKWRLAVLPLLVSIIGVCFMGLTPVRHTFGFLLTSYVWFPSDNYKNNGLCAAMLINMQASRSPEPANYNPATIDSICSKYMPQDDGRKIDNSDSVRPDIIIVINESFWDPTLLTKVSYSRDPLENFHSLQKKHGSLMTYSPAYGGFSANAEFEIITGMNVSFMPPGTVPYVHHIMHRTPSVASVLSEMGYDTIALYATSGRLYRTGYVASLLGFKKVYTTDEIAQMREYGLYIPDRVTMDQAIKIIDRQGPAPMFLMCVTIENHSPYDDSRFDSVESGIQIDGPLSNMVKEQLDNYIVGLVNADKSLAKLVDCLQKRTRPTLMLFLGDHLPGIGWDYGMYREGGLIAESGSLSEEDRLKVHSVPTLLWSNFSSPGVLENRSMSFILPMLLEQANLPHTAFCGFLEKLRKANPAVGYEIAPPGGVARQDAAGSYDVLKEYELLQYDMIFGQQRAADLFSMKKVSNHQAELRGSQFSSSGIKPTDAKTP